MNVLSKIAVFLVFCTALLLQGCAMNSSNILCAGPGGCVTEGADIQLSQLLGEKMYRHSRYKDLFVHGPTDAWEASQTCGQPGFLTTIAYSLVGGVIQGASYKFIANPYVAGAVGGSANAALGLVNQSNLSKACRNAVMVSAEHNAQPDIAREIVRWTVRKQLAANKLNAEVTAELTGQVLQPVVGVQPTQAPVTQNNGFSSIENYRRILSYCARSKGLEYPQNFAGMADGVIVKTMDSACQSTGKGRFKVLNSTPGQELCGCG